MKDKTELRIVIFGIKNLMEVNHAETFMEVLKRQPESFMPIKIGCHQPSKEDFNLHSLSEMWAESELKFKKNTGNLGGGISFRGEKSSDMYGEVDWVGIENDISLNFSIKFINNVGLESIIKYIQELFTWSNGVYGYGFHSAQDGIHYTPGLTYKNCLGGITWMALFGLPYVEMFGRDYLRSAPCLVEEFTTDKYMLLTSEVPCEPTEFILEKQRKVMEYLGKDVFWRRDWPSQESYTFEDIMAGKHLTSKEGYRSPDFVKYYGPKVRIR